MTEYYQFKEGDLVTTSNSCSGAMAGKVYTVFKTAGGNVAIGDYYNQNGDACTCTERWSLVTNQKNNMNLKERFALAFKDEPERTFIKAGVMDVRGELTTEGREIWTAFLVKKFGAEFKTEVVDKLLEAEEAGLPILEAGKR